jgi:hypothetical protein
MASKVVTKLKEKGKNNTVGVIAGLISLLIVLLVVIISIKVASDRRSEKLKETGSTASQQSINDTNLLEGIEDSSVKVSVAGGVSANEKHYSITMSVSSRARTIEVTNTYLDNQHRLESLENNSEAYIAFLNALNRFDFTKSRKDNSGYSQEQACPNRKSYTFAFYKGAYEQFSRWYTTCNDSRYGEYGGKVSSVYSLFKEQFPKYSDYTSGIVIED